MAADSIRVAFVRHGEGVHNVAAAIRGMEAYKDPALFDASLNENGRAQARELGARTRALKFDVVFVSPLTRAIQTVAGMLGIDPATGAATATGGGAGGGGEIPPVWVVEDLREACGLHPCDARRPTAELRARYPWLRFDPSTPDTDLLHSPDARETLAHVTERGARFLSFLSGRPERSCLVVSHGVLLEQTVEDPRLTALASTIAPVAAHKRFANCEIRLFTLPTVVGKRAPALGPQLFTGSAPALGAGGAGAVAARVSKSLRDLHAPPSIVSVLSYAQEQRDRAYMEDKAFGVVLTPTELPGPPGQAEGGKEPTAFLCGVVDGHGGSEVASFCRDEFMSCLTHMAGLAHAGAALPFSEQAAAEGVPAGRRQQLFAAVLELEHRIQHATGDAKRHVAWTQGAVAAFALVEKRPDGTRRLYVANTGDVEVVMGVRKAGGGKDCIPAPLSVKHVASDPAEAAAIRSRGGFVLPGGGVGGGGPLRAQGDLMPSRVLGDIRCKPYVSATPHVTAIDLGPAAHREDFLIVATDGVWDHLSHAAAVAAVAAHTAAGKPSAQAADAILRAAAGGAGAAAAAVAAAAPRDNASALVLFF